MENDGSLYDGLYEEGGEIFDYKISDLNEVTKRIQNMLHDLDKVELIKVGKEEIEKDIQHTKELSSKLKDIVESLTLDELYDKEEVQNKLEEPSKGETQHQGSLHKPEPIPHLPGTITSITPVHSLTKIKPTTIQSMLFLSNGKQFITGTTEGDLSLYNITPSTCTLVCEIYLGSKNKDKKSEINFIYEINTTTLACATSLNKVFIVSITDTSLTKINKLKGHTNIVVSVIALNNNTIISSSYDHTIKIFNYLFDNNNATAPFISIEEEDTLRNAISLVKISDTTFVANWKYLLKSELMLYNNKGELLETFDSKCKGCVASNGLFFIPKGTKRKNNNEHLVIGYDDENTKGEIIFIDLPTKDITIIEDIDNVIRCFEPMCFALYNEEYLLHSQNGTFSQIEIDGRVIVKYFKESNMFMGKLLGVLSSSSFNDVIVVDNEERELIDQSRNRYRIYPGITTYKLTF